MSAAATVGQQVGTFRDARVRILVCGQNKAAYHLLLHITSADPCFQVCGFAEDWTSCERLIELYVPDVLILSRTSVPVGRSQGQFCVLVVTESEILSSVSSATDLNEQVITDVRRELTDLFGRVLLAKGEQLRWLFERYQDGLSRVDHADFLEARCDGVATNLPVGQIEWIEGDGDWVKLHSQRKVYEVRELISEIASRLSPASFIRIHRSTVINAQHIDKVIVRSALPVCIRMRSGDLLPVGTTYRNVIRHSVLMNGSTRVERMA